MLMISDIQRAVCEHFGLAKDELLSDKRARRISRPRQIGMYLAHEMTGKSFPQIGRRFGRDHSTVCYAVHEIRRRRDERGPVYHHLNQIRRRVLEGAQS